MTLKECLEEVCKFLNWTVFEYGGSVYFIDVDYINKGSTTYTNILNNQSVTLSSPINLRNITSKGNGNSLSILGGYNKVTVIDSDYEADSDKLYPEMNFDAIGGINYVEKSVDGKMYKKYWCYYPVDFKLHNYTWTGSVWRESTQTEINQDTDKNLAGVYPVKTTNYSIDDKPNSLTYTNEFEIHQRYKTNTDNYLYSNNGIYKLLFFNDIHILLFELKLSYDTFIDLYYHLEDYLSFNCTYCLSYEFYSDNNKYFFTVIPTINSHDTDTEIYELCILQNCQL